MYTRVQVAGVSSLEEATFLVDHGVDALGFTLRLPSGVHDGLTEDLARRLIAALPPFVARVLITYIDNPGEAIDLCRFLGVDVLQLHGPFPEREIDRIRVALPHLKVLRAVHVVDATAIDEAQRVARRVDALILDTYDPQTGRHGATGKVHDWQLSRQIVASVARPVILAGGLTAENVRQAIATVRPWAVDVHTGVEDADGTRNFTRMRRFLAAVKGAGRVSG